MLVKASAQPSLWRTVLVVCRRSLWVTLKELLVGSQTLDVMRLHQLRRRGCIEVIVETVEGHELLRVPRN
jgi:hypothetical protein